MSAFREWEEARWSQEIVDYLSIKPLFPGPPISPNTDCHSWLVTTFLAGRRSKYTGIPTMPTRTAVLHLPNPQLHGQPAGTRMARQTYHAA